MFESVLLGVGKRLVPVPECLFRPMVRRDAAKLAKRSMLERDERRIQYFVVREIPRRRAPISPQDIATDLGLLLDEVARMLDELERRMTFLCRRGGDDVVWAYPVTAEETVHQVEMEVDQPFSAA